MEQIALGLKALESANRALRKAARVEATPRDKEISAAIRELLAKLALRRSHGSPHGFRPREYDQSLEQILIRLK